MQLKFTIAGESEPAWREDHRGFLLDLNTGIRARAASDNPSHLYIPHWEDSTEAHPDRKPWGLSRDVGKWSVLSRTVRPSISCPSARGQSSSDSITPVRRRADISPFRERQPVCLHGHRSQWPLNSTHTTLWLCFCHLSFGLLGSVTSSKHPRE